MPATVGSQAKVEIRADFCAAIAPETAARTANAFSHGSELSAAGVPSSSAAPDGSGSIASPVSASSSGISASICPCSAASCARACAVSVCARKRPISTSVPAAIRALASSSRFKATFSASRAASTRP